MPKGDQLARGGKIAQFQQAVSASELENDLKIHLPEFVISKYSISGERYAELVSMLQRGVSLPSLSPVLQIEPEPDLIPVAEDPFDPGPVPPVEVESPAPEPLPPASRYRGKARGDHVLVQRVEKEHSSNLIIPDSMKAKSDIGFIYSAGEKCDTFRPGMLVLFDRFSSHGADIDLIDEDGIERKLLLLREYDIQCELEKVAHE
jgi:co-chaperonin GroES (HSP10)